MAAKKSKKPDFHKLRFKVGLSQQDECAEFCGVSERTIKRWDETGAPPIATRLLRLYDRKDLSGIGPGWEGFMASRGALINARLKIRLTPERLRQWRAITDSLDQAEAEINKTANLCPIMRLARTAAKKWAWAAPVAQALEAMAWASKRRHDKTTPATRQAWPD